MSCKGTLNCLIYVVKTVIQWLLYAIKDQPEIFFKKFWTWRSDDLSPFWCYELLAVWCCVIFSDVCFPQKLTLLCSSWNQFWLRMWNWYATKALNSYMLQRVQKKKKKLSDSSGSLILFYWCLFSPYCVIMSWSVKTYFFQYASTLDA